MLTTECMIADIPKKDEVLVLAAWAAWVVWAEAWAA